MLVLYFLAALGSFILLYLGFTYLLFFFPVNKNAAAEGLKELSIFVMSNGVHTDIVVPVKNEIMDWTRMTKFEHTESKDTTFKFVAFGWGDKGFYLETPQWSDLKFSVAFNAMFHLGSTAMHVDFIHEMHQNKNFHYQYCQHRKCGVHRLLSLDVLPQSLSSFQNHRNGHRASEKR